MLAVPTATPRSRRVIRRRFSVAVVAVAVVCGACGGGEAPSAERFCGEVDANKEALTNPQLAYSDDIAPLLELYRKVGALAPLGVSDDWNHIVSAYETASTVVLDDPASEQEALAAIYSAEKSAAAVDTWLRANCAVDIGPVFTIVPHGPTPVGTAPIDSVPPVSTP